MENSNKRGCLKIILVTTAFLLVAVAAFYFILWRVPDNSQKVKPFLNEMKEKLDKKVNSSGSSNALPYYEKAAKISFAKNKQVFDPLLSQGVTEKDKSVLKRKLKDMAPIMVEVGDGFRNELIFKDIDLRKKQRWENFNFKSLMRLVQDLTLLGELGRIEGNRREAADSFLPAVHLGACFGNNGTITSQMMGLALLRPVMSPFLDMLRYDEMDEDTCRYITGEMIRINRNVPSFQYLLDGELLVMEFYFDDASKSNLGVILKTYVRGRAASGRLMKAAGLVPGAPFIERERKIYENWFLLQRSNSLLRFSKARAAFKSYKMPRVNILSSTIIPNIDRAYVQYCFETARLRGAMITAALRWYKLKEGDYPDKLSDLVPDYLPEIPRDPFSPDWEFEYAKTEKGVDFYSIGVDQTDDKGRTEVKFPLEKGDIVFLSHRDGDRKSKVKEEKVQK